MMLTLIGAAALPLLAPLPVAGPAPRPQTSSSFAVRARTLLLGDGTTLEDGVLWVEAGKIRAVGRGVEPPPGTPVIEHAGVLTAGMVGAHSYSGGGAELTDSTRAFLPEGRAEYAFDPRHSDFRRAVRAGITSLVLAPRETNVAGGLTAVVKCAGGRVLEPAAHLHLSLHTTSLWGWREPTSWPGVLKMLDEHLAAGKGAFGEVAAGRLPVVIEAWDRHEVARALAFATKYGLRGALRGGWRAGELADRVAASGLAVIAGPFDPGEDSRYVASVVALSESGIDLAFGLDSPAFDPAQMRMSAAMCVRAGLDPTTAWHALTRTAAEIAGVGDRVGRLENGLEADFVLWSGSPLELTSRVQAVYIDGVRVFGGERGSDDGDSTGDDTYGDEAFGDEE
jgi:hypothetical protein